MTIIPIPNETGRFIVPSFSREDVAFVVDLQYSEHGERPHPACGCENYMAQGVDVCKHIRAVVAFESRRLGL